MYQALYGVDFCQFKNGNELSQCINFTKFSLIIRTSMFWLWPSYRAEWSYGLYLPVADPILHFYLHVSTMAFTSCRLELRFIFASCRPWFTIIITSMFRRWPSYHADWSWGLYLPVADPDLQLLLPPCFDDGLHIVQTGAAVYICQLQTLIYNNYMYITSMFWL